MRAPSPQALDGEISSSQTLDAGCLEWQAPLHGQVVLGGQVGSTTVVMGGGSRHISRVFESFLMMFKYAMYPIESSGFRPHRLLV